MHYRLLDDVFRLVDIACEGPCNKGGSQADCDREGINGFLENALPFEPVS